MTTIVVLVPDHGDPNLMQPRDPRWTPPLHLRDVDGSTWLLRIEIPILDRDAHVVAVYSPWAPPPDAEVRQLRPGSSAPEPTPPDVPDHRPAGWTPDDARAAHPSRRT